MKTASCEYNEVGSGSTKSCGDDDSETCSGVCNENCAAFLTVSRVSWVNLLVDVVGKRCCGVRHAVVRINGDEKSRKNGDSSLVIQSMKNGDLCFGENW